MSTILDALKRLEKERRDDHAQAPQSMTERAVHSPMARRRTTFLIVGGLVAIGVVAVLVWFNGGLPGKALPPNKPSPDPVAGMASPDVMEGPATIALRHEKGTEESVGTTNADLPLTSRKPATRERARAQAPASRQTVPPMYSEQFKGKSFSTGFSPSRSTTASQSPERATRTKPVTTLRQAADTQMMPNQDPYADAEPLARATLQLQAISWSDSPSARITVIDGRILREGHSIEGYTVIQIRPEDIIVGKEGKSWKLAYGRP